MPCTHTTMNFSFLLADVQAAGAFTRHVPTVFNVHTLVAWCIQLLEEIK